MKITRTSAALKMVALRARSCVCGDGRMRNALVRLMGWKATVLHGDPCVFDRWKWLKRHLVPGPLRTLDAGCGSGALTMYASKLGNEALGISFDEWNNQAARFRSSMLGIRNVEFMHGDLRNLDKMSSRLGKFDQIICFETVEHIQGDRKLLRDLSTLLKSGGRLLLTTPSKDHKPLWGERLSESEDGGHVRWGYTHEELRALFSECGLEVMAEEYLSGVISQQLTNLMRLLGKANVIVAWAIIFPLRILQILDSPLTRLLGYQYLSVGVVGVKRNSSVASCPSNRGNNPRHPESHSR